MASHGNPVTQLFSQYENVKKRFSVYGFEFWGYPELTHNFRHTILVAALIAN